MQIKSCLMIGIGTLIILFISHRSLAYSALPAPEIFLKDSAPYGTPYNEWLIKWWQWHISLPTKGHPLMTPNIVNCPVGESGQVSFLAHSLQGESHYTCTIPVGHAILIPISMGECNSNEAHSESDPVLIKCATEGQKHATFDVTIDGTRLNGLEQNYAISRFFNMIIPEDNVFNFKAGTFKAVVAGYYAFVKPLLVGSHTVDINAKNTDPIDRSLNFAYHTSLLLNVK
jgi:hypothetical protein